jgi:major membrane immunogen (membrane-anchored lipoprotein)
MKKTVFFLLAAAAFLTSCAKPDKCKCTIKVDDITLDDQVIERPADTNCSQIKVKDIEGEIVNIDLSKLATIKCVNYND